MLNLWAEYKSVKKVTKDLLHRAYLKIQEPVEKTLKQPEPPKNVKENKPPQTPKEKKQELRPALRDQKGSVHCELTLAVAFVNAYRDDPTPPHLTIGVSKVCCLLCREFISILHQFYPHIRIITPSCHGKITAGWRMPQDTPQEVIDSMMNRVDGLVHEVMAKSTNRVRLDSLQQDFSSSSSSEESSPKSDHIGAPSCSR